MKYYIMRIDSLANTFSIVESGKKVVFEYTSALGQEVLAEVKPGDEIIGCTSASNLCKMLFRVDGTKIGNRITLIKELDLAQGGTLSTEFSKKLADKEIYEITEQEYKSLYEDMLKDLVKSESENKKFVISDADEENLSVEQLGQILSKMYDDPDAASKTTGIHIFGIKFGKIIKKNGYSPASIITAAGLSENYQVELGKGLRIYESLKDDEFGVKFYEGEEIEKVSSTELKNCLEVQRNPRTNKLHPLNLIIYGAPGTGKTYSTAEYALAILNNRALDTGKKSDAERKEVIKLYKDYIRKGQVVFTTFHQSYGYEEFIQGLRPDTKSEKMAFRTVDGVFKHIADVALNDHENNYVIIIDEINRANISKVFGELITLIEEDKRWGEVNETCATLQSGDVFAVPNNLYIVGTMNSADKSISLIDAALRRRFDFVEQKPEPDLVENQNLRLILSKMNSKLADELDSSDLLIGHSYFMNRAEEELPTILNNNIIPLLYEYFYDNKKKVANVLDYSLGDMKVEIVDDKMGRLRVKKKDE